MAVKLWPTLPKDHESNGLTALERPLIEDSEGPYYFVAEVNRRRSTIDDDDATETPTIRVLHGEALFGDDAKTARNLLAKVQAERCGTRAKPPTLPFGDGPGDENPGPDDDDGSDGDGRAKGYDQPEDHQGEGSEPGTSDSPESPRFLSAVE